MRKVTYTNFLVCFFSISFYITDHSISGNKSDFNWTLCNCIFSEFSCSIHKNIYYYTNYSICDNMYGLNWTLTWFTLIEFNSLTQHLWQHLRTQMRRKLLKKKMQYLMMQKRVPNIYIYLDFNTATEQLLLYTLIQE